MRLICLAAGAVLIAACASSARGQSFGTSGPGQSSMGGSSFGSSTPFGTSSFNSGAAGGNRGAGGFGSMSSRSGGFGQFGLGSMNGFFNSSGANQRSMYGNASNTGNTSAYGNGAAASRPGQQYGGARARGTTGLNGRGNNRNANNSNRRRSGSQPNTAAGRPYGMAAPNIDIDVDTLQPQNARVLLNLRRSLRSSSPLSRFGTIEVSLEGGTAVLRGTVASENERALAEQVAMLEPSISEVRNELTVQVPAVAPRPTPASL
jgi:hypothetical protein